MSEFNTGTHPAGTHSTVASMSEMPSLSSAVSWAAIFAGAAGAAALSLLLLILGTGLGFSVVSPWSMEGIGASTFGFAAIAWLTFTQLAASGMGGYLAGRLRTKWTAVHTDEVYFRDTAHGFLTWAVASLLMVVVLTLLAGSIVSGGVRAGAEVVGGASSAAMQSTGGSNSLEDSNTIEYFVDSLFRDEPTSFSEAAAQQNSEINEVPVGEVTRIFARALRTGTLPEQDERYIGQLVAQRTDMNQREAEQHVSESFSEVQITLEELEISAREAADEARKASAYGALWMFITLLIGAFTASLMAVFGGRQRDACTHDTRTHDTRTTAI
ncbi:hypothetical protein [Nitrincola sp. MINF-07-Sa-05]|uniref:hypothetical protein n=1 Tax=Nitrincola salilacus TaxID=3400273 RepID=UPI003917D53E